MAENKTEKELPESSSDIKAHVLLAKLLKFAATPNADKVAQSLLKRFDSFAGVANAAANELVKVEGVTERAAELISLVPFMFRRYMDDTEAPELRVYSSEVAYKLIRNKFFGRKSEIVVLLILNSRGQVVYNNIISYGSVKMVPVYIKDVMRLCVEYNADAVFLAHNHPSGNPSPSRGDLMATREVQLALESIYVSMADHLIFTDTDYFSMRNSGSLKRAVAECEKLRSNFLARALAEELSYFGDAE